MKRTLAVAVLSVGGTLLLLPALGSERAFAQEWTIPVRFSIKLFDAVRTFDTGPVTSPGEAVPFGADARPSTDCEGGGGVGVCRVTFARASGDVAVISSREEGPGGIVIDNFMTINGVNVCDRVPPLPEQLFPGSCFGEILDFTFPTDVPIETVLEPIPPVDVTEFLGFGEDTLDFELLDFGEIAGNTDLFLVILQVPQKTRDECQRDALDEFERDVQACEGERERCEEREAEGFVSPGFCVQEEVRCMANAQDKLARTNEDCLRLPS